MSTIRRIGYASLLLTTLLPAAFADEPEVWIIQSIRDEPLEKAVNRIALLGGVKVTVEKGLREKKISLQLDALVEDALDQVATAAGAHLVKTGPKSFEIRSTPSPAGGAAEKPVPEPSLPEWARPLAEKLEKTEVSYQLEGDPLPKVLAWLSRETGVKIRLDARKGGVRLVIDRKIARQFADDRIDLDVEDMPLLEAFGLVLAPRGLTLGFRGRSLTVLAAKD